MAKTSLKKSNKASIGGKAEAAGSAKKGKDAVKPNKDVASSKDVELQEKKASPSKKRRHSQVDDSVSKPQLSKQESEWDARLPDEYKKYRPRGYPLYLPEDTKQNFRVYCDGIYDLFHLGHMNQLKQCKEMFPNVTLVVGVPADEVTWKNKGLTVLSDEQRCETLKHCKWVDEVIPDAPWSVTPEFLEEHDIDYVAHDDIPYASAESDDVYAPVKKIGKFLVTQRTEGISTSDIITKIIRDYDKYLLRNFARGASRQDLNVSWFKKNELDIKKHIDEFRQYWKKTNGASKDLYYEIREYLRSSSNALKRINSNPSINSFAEHMNSLNSRSPSPPEPLSPATEFAMKYSGNKNLQARSIINSFKKWVFKRERSESETPTDTTKESISAGSDLGAEELEVAPKRKKQRTKSSEV